MRNPIKVSLLVAGLALSALSFAEKPLPVEIKQATEKFGAAIRWNSPGVLRNLIYEYSTPEYTSEMEGRKLDLYGEVESVAMFAKTVQKVYSCKTRIVSYRWCGPNVEMTYAMSGDFLMVMGPKPQRVHIDSVYSSVWTSAYGGWKMMSQKPVKEKMTPVNGRRGRKH